MRVLIDTNIFISYLLSPAHTAPVQTLLRAALEQRYTLLISSALLDEIYATVTSKPHLSSRIPPAQLREFLDLLTAIGEELPRAQQPIPRISRDEKDDFLIAYAILGEADCLVTGDKDVLVLSDIIEKFAIVTPRQFIEML